LLAKNNIVRSKKDKDGNTHPNTSKCHLLFDYKDKDGDNSYPKLIKRSNMIEQNINNAEAYYMAMHNKDVVALARYLHNDVKFIGPLAEVDGKENVVAAATKFMQFLNSIRIRTKFGSENQAIVVYEMNCLPPIDIFKAVTLMTFKDSLIISLELFYDARPFERKRDDIFTPKSPRN
jgi:hypothetical protein